MYATLVVTVLLFLPWCVLWIMLGGLGRRSLRKAAVRSR
jgi:hypothetical protein